MIEYLSPIDPHVHLRGREYATNFAEMAIRDATEVGLAGVIEQPNPQPWLVDEESIRSRSTLIGALCKRMYNSGTLNNEIPHVSCHIGLTTSPDQVIAAVRFAMSTDRALKIFFVHSTGNMGIISREYQRWIWQTLAVLGFKGVVIGHFEAEDLFEHLFNHQDPVTHSIRQNEKSEKVQVARQLNHAHEAGFEGTFYVAHVSSPKTVDQVKFFRQETRPKFPIILEATWHHLLLNHSDYAIHGNRVKMNPPLRSEESQKELFQMLLDGQIDIIGTDHAPHPVEAKDSSTPPSGIPALPFWPRGIEILRAAGASENLIVSTTFSNANEIFGLDIEPETVIREYDITLWDKYGFNPFSRLS